tara:strand:+ start:276 stop:1124 length:849 start_codon:yes stop_codon:yes gene_type:complete
MKVEIAKITDEHDFLRYDENVRLKIIEMGCILYEKIQTSEIDIKLKKESDDNVVKLLENMNKERESRINELIEKNNNQWTEIESMKRKFLCNATKKGQDGEESIETYLMSNMEDIEILNTAKKTAAGDMNIVIDDIKILIESKNKYKITKEDVEKFKRDTINMGSNIGIFVSIKDINIPYRGNLGFEIYEGIPLLYISNFENEPNWLKMVIEIGMKIYKKNKWSIRTGDNEKLNAHLTEIFECMKSVIPIIREVVKDTKNSLKNITKLEKIISDRIDGIINL